MKKLLMLLGIFLLCAGLYAQTPQAINYQGLALNAQHNVINNQTVSLRLSVISGTLAGPTVYAETHSVTTDAYGLFALQIGKGSVVSGTFASLDWGSGDHFLKVEIDATGGTAFTLMGINQFVSVPYALHAKTAENGFSGSYTDLTNTPTFATVATSGSYNDLLNLPALFDGTFLSLTGKPTTLFGYGITDAMSTAHAANAITTANIADWEAAYGWGNHAGLYRPVSYVPAWGEVTGKPTFAPVATSGSYNDLLNLPALFDGTFLSLTGKPTTLFGYGITDAMSTAHAANAITTANIADWEAAYGWGNHAGLYRPVSYVPAWGEVTGKPTFATVATSGSYSDLINLPALFDGTFLSLTGKPTTLSGYGITDAMSTAHAANVITTANIADWEAAYGWGNHAGLYRPVSYVPAWGEVTGKPIFATVATSGSYSDLINLPALFDGTFLSLTGKPTTLGGYSITDAMSTAHAANAITTANIADWEAAYGWGNHAGLYRPISYVPAWNEITSNPFSFGTATNNQILKYNSGTGKWENWTPNFLTSFTETDPIFGAWDKSSGINITASQVSDFATAVTNTPAVLANTAKNSYPTEDAAKLAGIAAGAEVNVNPDWNATSGDAQILNKPIGTNPGDMLYWNGTAWVNIQAPATNGQTLTFCNGVPHWGPCLDFATLTTTEVTALTGFTATTGGNVTNNGGSTVTERGICLATTIEPDIYDITFAGGNGTGNFSINLTGLLPSTTYYTRAYATNTSGTAYGNEVLFTTLTLPSVTTTEATTVTTFTATSGGNVTNSGGTAVSSRGICYGTSINPTTANTTIACGNGTGIFTSLLTNLAQSTTYYLRAYATNSAGTAYGNQIEFTTQAWSCGDALPISHVTTSLVAPVDKTTTYGTVTNIPGEPTKCWITQNLGSDHQATAFDDATEASAGWYWQFNRKQGFKHDGATRTPSTTWISSIDENSDWTPADDPCTLELGSVWRIPTSTEWENVEASGGWTNWNGPWNSGLKLHAAGYMRYSDGSLDNRGLSSHYWSSVQYSTALGWFLYFDSGQSLMNTYNKAHGFSVRCLRD